MSFFNSEIERAFARIAKQKGWTKEQEIKKVASSNSLKSTSDLFIDICSLANSLRDRGYVKQAALLEEKVLQYKKAESALYNIHEDTMEDLVEFAHPEDFEFNDDPLGDVETILSAHKKILDVVNKEPKKKASIDSIKKEAQEAVSDYLTPFLSKISFELDLKSLIDMFRKNSGPMYDFINVYYNDLFKKFYAYYTAVYTIYGGRALEDLALGRKLNPGSIALQLSDKNPAEYITSVQRITGLDLMDLIPDTVSAQTEQLSWIFSKKGELSNKIHERFNQKYSGIENEINRANLILSNRNKSLIDSLNSSKGTKAEFYEFVKGLATNGVYKYMTQALLAFYNNELVNAFSLSYENTLKANSSMAEINPERLKATIGRLEWAINYVNNSGQANKYAPTLNAMTKIMNALKFKSSSLNQLLSNMPDGFTYGSYDELDKDTMTLLEVLKKEIG